MNVGKGFKSVGVSKRAPNARVNTNRTSVSCESKHVVFEERYINDQYDDLSLSMDRDSHLQDHRKRHRRRRNVERPPLNAWLTFNDRHESDVAWLSKDLFKELFPGNEALIGNLYIAIRLWSRNASYHTADIPWTIVVAQTIDSIEDDIRQNPPNSLQISAASDKVQSILTAGPLGLVETGNSKTRERLKVSVLDVNPIDLDSIVLAVDGDALKKHDAVQRQFGHGFGYRPLNAFQNKGKGKARAISSEDVVGTTSNGDGLQNVSEQDDDRVATVVREGLASSKLVRQDQLISLPFPAHPITHVSFPRARIIICEPLIQGLATSSTKITIDRVYRQDASSHRDFPARSRYSYEYKTRQDDVESSQDKGSYSSEAGDHHNVLHSDHDYQSLHSEDSDEENTTLSDNSLDGIISLNSSILPTWSSGVLSSRTAATPKALVSRMNGTSTPRSVYSNYSAATSRQVSAVGGLAFETHGLLNRIADDLLHPKPQEDEDEEARVFVDITYLVKLGCFSGDWVRLQSSPAPDENGLWDVGAFNEDGEAVEYFRSAKIYGITDPLFTANLRYLKGMYEDNGKIRRNSSYKKSVPNCWLSPIMLYNLGQPSYIEISLMTTPQDNAFQSRHPRKASKVSNSSSPPIAKEITLMKVATPLSTERTLQAGLFAGLKQYFEHKRRILRQDDLIAFTIDAEISRTLTQSNNSSDADREIEETLALSNDQREDTRSLGVAWFKVGHVITGSLEPDDYNGSSCTWGENVSIEPMTTRMVQAGTEQCKIPPTMKSTWEFYCGQKQLPKSERSDSIKKWPKSYISSLRRKVRELVAAGTSLRSAHLGMKPMVILLHSTQRNIGKAYLVTNACSDLGVHVFTMDAYDILTEGGAGGDVKTEAILKARVERALACGPGFTTLLIRHIDALNANRMISAMRDIAHDFRVFIATTTEIDKVPEGVRSLFTHELGLTAPDEGEREGILRNVIEQRGVQTLQDVDLAAIAVKTAALVAGDLVDVVDRAIIAKQDRLELIMARNSVASRIVLMRDVLVSGGRDVHCLTKADFDVAIDAARKNFADAIGAPKIPNVSWDDVGGLQNVKDAVMETIQLPLERPELFAKGMKKRSGVLFYGPPGTGKTLLAKAIATEFSLNFFSVKGPELLNMYIGESEANVRRVFQRARDARPCVVFFDELDSVAPKRGNQGDSGGVMDRIVSQLLAELDGMSDGDDSGEGVFVIGATNRPDLLDQALLRPGRFDKMLYLGISDTHDKQLAIIEALTRKFNLHPETSLRRVADSLPFTYTGADLYALCSDAMLKAITRQANAVDSKIKARPGKPVTTAYFFDHLANEDDVKVMVMEEDFLAAQRELVGSVR